MISRAIYITIYYIVLFTFKYEVCLYCVFVDVLIAIKYITSPHILYCTVLYCTHSQVLSDMQSLERHPIMRIVNEFERRDKEERNK